MEFVLELYVVNVRMDGYMVFDESAHFSFSDSRGPNEVRQNGVKWTK